jgi:hypothetical protein
MSLMTLRCPQCHEDRPFERPHPAGAHVLAASHDVAEAHDLADCPELACAECGTAVFSGCVPPITAGAAEFAGAQRRGPGRAA